MGRAYTVVELHSPTPTLACSWIDSKPVHFLSTIHNPEYDNTIPAAGRVVKRKGQRGRGIQISCPPLVHDYNKFMGGVNFADRIVKYYNCARRSRKWYRRVIFHLLEVSVHNSFILEGSYKEHYSDAGVVKRYHQNFREELAEQLVGGYRAGGNRGGRPSDAFTREDRFINVGVHEPVCTDTSDCALCLQRVKNEQPGGVIPRGVSRHSVGVHRSNIACSRCKVNLCVKQRNCWQDWHHKV